MSRSRSVLTLACAAYLVVVGLVTLLPQSGSRLGSPLYRLAEFFGGNPATAWLTFNTLEFSANIVLFIPIGLLLTLMLGRRRWWVAILAGVAFTAAIEFTQRFLPTRVSDVRDIVANTLGAIVGTLLAIALVSLATRRSARSLPLVPGR